MVFPVGRGQKSRRVTGRLREGGEWVRTTGAVVPRLVGGNRCAGQGSPASRVEKAGWGGEEVPSRVAISPSLAIIAGYSGFDLPRTGASTPHAAADVGVR